MRVAALILAVASAPVLAQATSCPSALLSQAEELQRLFAADDVQALGEVRAKKAAVATAKAPPIVAPSVQRASPSSSSTAPSPVDGADSPSVFALAVDNNLISSEDRAVTIAFSPFAYQALANPAIVDDQATYARYEPWRKWGGSVTLGGKGEAFDRDGDGTVDEALEAEELGDIVSWEIRYRLFGSRDARDNRWARRFQAAAAETARNRFAAVTELGRRWAKFKAATPDIFFTDPKDKQQKVCADAIERFLTDSDNHDMVGLLSGIRDADHEIEELSATFQREIEKSPVWSLVFGGTDRKSEFGPDRWLLAMRGAIGDDENGFTANLDYSMIDVIGGGPDSKVFKGGLEWSRLFLSGRIGRGKNTGLRVSASAAYEKFEDVPDATHDTVAKVNVKLEWPINEYLTLPFSLTWANHEDLLSDEKEIRGFIGFTVDVGSLLDFEKAGAEK